MAKAKKKKNPELLAAWAAAESGLIMAALDFHDAMEASKKNNTADTERAADQAMEHLRLSTVRYNRAAKKVSKT